MHFSKVFLIFFITIVLYMNLSEAGQKVTKMGKKLAPGIAVGAVAYNSSATVHVHSPPTNKPSSSKKSKHWVAS